MTAARQGGRQPDHRQLRQGHSGVPAQARQPQCALRSVRRERRRQPVRIGGPRRALVRGQGQVHVVPQRAVLHRQQVPQLGRPGNADAGRFNDGAALKASALNIDGVFSDKTDTGRLAGAHQSDDGRRPRVPRFARPACVRSRTPRPTCTPDSSPDSAAVVTFYNAGGGEPVAGSTKDPLLTPLGAERHGTGGSGPVPEDPQRRPSAEQSLLAPALSRHAAARRAESLLRSRHVHHLHRLRAWRAEAQGGPSGPARDAWRNGRRARERDREEAGRS